MPRVVPNDPDDDHVIAATWAAHADCIFSGDSDLLSLESFKEIPILTATKVVAMLAT